MRNDVMNLSCHSNMHVSECTKQMTVSQCSGTAVIFTRLMLVLQAMAAYRTAARLFRGLHMPLVGMGMEYMRMNNLPLAQQLFDQVPIWLVL